MVARMMRFPDMRHAQKGRLASLAEIGGICSSRGAFMEGPLETPGIQAYAAREKRANSEEDVGGTPRGGPFVPFGA
jgi:hypothetical protein